MGNILLVSENLQTIEKFKLLLNTKVHNFYVSTSLTQILKEIRPDVCIIEDKPENISTFIKNIKSGIENVQILIYSNADNMKEDNSGITSGYIFDFYNSALILSTINNHLRTKKSLDKLSERNRTLANSLYRLNVLYNTSSQFAGSLDSRELIKYMVEGLDKSLSFDLSCILSFGIEDQPALVINSLYDISEELLEALKQRTIKNYQSFFTEADLPYFVNENNLRIIKNIKNTNRKLDFSVFDYDNMLAQIDLGEKFFGCIEIFKEKTFTTDDATYFQTIVQQVSLPLKSAGLYKEILEKNEELEKLQRIKSEFISIVSHELRTPLTPIKNALSILSSGRCGQMGDNAIKFLNMARRNVDNLTNIINDILDINKIEAGKMDFSFSKMNIKSVIENVKTTFDYVAKEHNIILTSEIQENLPDIYADSQRLGQVLTNLVSNALKFTPDGKKVTIKSVLKNSDEISVNNYFKDEISNLSGNYIVVSVKDEGIGISENNLLRVFEKFTQIENSLSRKAGGTGLGLPIARQLVKAHRGAIWCDSAEGVGTSFCFAIPVCAKEEESKLVQAAFI